MSKAGKGTKTQEAQDNFDARAADSSEKALDNTLGQIEKQFGQGEVVMKMGDKGSMSVESVPTGALLDLALGIGGMPRGRK